MLDSLTRLFSRTSTRYSMHQRPWRTWPPMSVDKTLLDLLIDLWIEINKNTNKRD
jgi:hypothetical protein